MENWDKAEAALWLPFMWTLKLLQAHTEFMNDLMSVLA